MEQLKEVLSIFGGNVYVQAGAAILLSLVAAKLIDWLITRGISQLTRRTRSKLDDELVRLLHRPIYMTVILIGCLAAILLLELSDRVTSISENVVATIVVIVWVLFGVRASTQVVAALTRDPERFKAFQPATRPLFETAAKLTLLALAIYFVLVSWGVDPVGWLATAGIAAVAVGLAAQETLGNLFAGISILADAPYKIGDFIVLEGQERGKVTRIGLRSTRILTRDDVEVTVPNSIIARSKIVNETSGRWVKQRLRIPIGVAYGSDPELVKSVLAEAAGSQKDVCDNPEPWVQFRGFGESSLDFEIRLWIDDPTLRGRIISAVNSEAYRLLKEKDIEIPFPKRDIYIKELPAGLFNTGQK